MVVEALNTKNFFNPPFESFYTLYIHNHIFEKYIVLHLVDPTFSVLRLFIMNKQNKKCIRIFRTPDDQPNGHSLANCFRRRVFVRKIQKNVRDQKFRLPHATSKCIFFSSSPSASSYKLGRTTAHRSKWLDVIIERNISINSH